MKKERNISGRRIGWRALMAVLGLLMLSVSLTAQTLPEAMSPPRLVNDFAGMLTEEQRQALDQKLTEFDRQTSNQITIVTVKDLQGYAPGDYTQRLHDKWGVGMKDKNNGILILLKPSMPDSRGEAYISVGYGLEGTIPDITAGQILDQEMIPLLKEGKVYEGLNQTTDVLMKLAKGEFSAKKYNQKPQLPGFVYFILILVFFGVISSIGRNKKGGGNNSQGGGGWIPPIFMGGGRSGGFGGGGGFGGFGGGGSGGGGAGRSW